LLANARQRHDVSHPWDWIGRAVILIPDAGGLECRVAHVLFAYLFLSAARGSLGAALCYVHRCVRRDAEFCRCVVERPPPSATGNIQ